MYELSIGVLVSSHPARWQSGMLNRCLSGITSQTRQPNQVVIANDIHQLGAAWCKQNALSALTTDWVAVIDSDDEMLPQHLEVLEREQLISKADLVYSWFEPVNMSDPFPPHFFTDPWDPEHPRHTTTTIMARRDMMSKVGYEQTKVEGHPYAEDDWLLSCGLIDLGAKVHHVAERTWRYHYTGHNTSGFAHNGDARFGVL